MSRRQARVRRCAKTRHHIRQLGRVRLSVHKTSQHMYATLAKPDGSQTLAAASTLKAKAEKKDFYTGSIAAAQWVGERIAELAKGLNIESVAFDRSGFPYHGRVKALAEAAREGGLKF